MFASEDIVHESALPDGANEHGKYFWTSTPENTKNVIRWASDKQVWSTNYQREYIQTVKNGLDTHQKCPIPDIEFAGINSLGWPSLEQWDALAKEPYCVPNHFRKLLPGDCYVVKAGTMHMLTKKRRELTADVDLKYDLKLSADGLSASANVYSILTELETKWMRDGAGQADTLIIPIGGDGRKTGATLNSVLWAIKTQRKYPIPTFLR
eukprot:g17791.t1